MDARIIKLFDKLGMGKQIQEQRETTLNLIPENSRELAGIAFDKTIEKTKKALNIVLTERIPAEDLKTMENFIETDGFSEFMRVNMNITKQLAPFIMTIMQETMHEIN